MYKSKLMENSKSGDANTVEQVPMLEMEKPQSSYVAGLRRSMSGDIDDDFTAPINSMTDRNALVESSNQIGMDNTNMNDEIDENSHGKSGNRVLNGLQFSLMLFLVTSAGPFGIESLLQSSSPFYAIIGILGVPIIYCLPQSLMCAELSSMIPENHGSLAWVYRGLGNFCGFIYCINDSFSTMTDIPTYIVLIGSYCKSWLNETFDKDSSLNVNLIVYFFEVFLVLIGTILNIFDVTVVGNASIIITFIIVIPLAVGFFMVLSNIETSVWLDTTTIKHCSDDDLSDNNVGICNWTLYFSSIIWLYTGWDTLSNVNGEVGFKLSSFLKTFIYAIVLDALAYLIPVITVFTIAYPKSNNYHNVGSWDDGYLNTAYFKIDYILGCFVFFAGIMSNFSMHLCESCTLSRELWAMAQDNAPKSKSKIDINAFEEESRIAIGILPKWFGYLHQRTNSPIVAIFAMFIANCILLTFSFEFLVELGTVQNCFSFIFEYSSLIALRYKEPDEPRPFKICGGMVGVWLLTLIKFLLIGTLMVVVSFEEPLIMVFCLGYNAVLSLYYFFYVKPKIRRRLEREKQIASISNLSDCEDSAPNTPINEQ